MCGQPVVKDQFDPCDAFKLAIAAFHSPPQATQVRTTHAELRTKGRSEGALARAFAILWSGTGQGVLMDGGRYFEVWRL